MKKILATLFLMSVANSGFSQKSAPIPNLAFFSTRDNEAGFIGINPTLEKFENVVNVRRNTMNTLKNSREALEGIVKDPLLGDETPTGANDVFTAYVGRLEKKYATLIRTLETDNIRDVFQVDQKSDLKKRYSTVVSASCLCNKNTGNYIKMKDLEGSEIVAFDLESLRGNTRYGLVENYRQGFARIKKDQVFGFLNTCGEEVIPAQYMKAEPFNDGRALVKKQEWFFVDVKGNESDALEGVVEAKALAKGISVAQFKNGKVALIDNTFDVSKKPISEFYDDIETFFKSELFKVRAGKLFGLLRIDGTIKTEPSFENLQPTNRPNYMRIIAGSKIGLIDSTGTTRLKPIYDLISDFNAYNISEVRGDEGTRLMNMADLRMTAPYASISSFDSQGMAIIQDASKRFGIMTNDLQVLKEPIFTSLSSFNQFGMAAACRDVQGQGNKCGYIRADGSVVIPFNYEEVGRFNTQGLVVVTEQVRSCVGEKGPCKTDLIYDQYGNLIVTKTSENEPEKIRYVLDTTLAVLNKQFIPVKTFTGKEANGTINLIDKISLRKITDKGYDRIAAYDKNLLFRVMKESKWGLIDTTGKVIAKNTFKRIENESEGLYAVQDANNIKWGFIDKKGKTQIVFEYDDVRPFYNGLAIVSKGKEKRGLINRFNGKIAPCVFKSVDFISNTRQYELTAADDSKFLLNLNGECEGNCQKFETIRKEANQQ
jgi:hypothetical protein